MPKAIPILLYHSIDTQCADAYRRWMMLPSEFRAHLQVLKEEGYTPLTVSQLVACRNGRGKFPEAPVVISFDDGLRDFLVGAMPVLAEFNYPATLYVVSGCVGQTSRWLAGIGEGRRAMLNWREIRELHDAGIEIGGHTVTHPELDILPASQAEREIADSKRQLQDGLQAEVRSFAYPHGYATGVTRSLARQAGYESACRVRHAFSSPDEDEFALSRIIATSEITAEGLRGLLAQPSLPVAPPVTRPASECWRIYRQVRHAVRGIGHAAP
jgi:peptidoglycan/xylan/chitin deacetylase (PgdA/CDA1 family)